MIHILYILLFFSCTAFGQTLDTNKQSIDTTQKSRETICYFRRSKNDSTSKQITSFKTLKELLYKYPDSKRRIQMVEVEYKITKISALFVCIGFIGSMASNFIQNKQLKNDYNNVGFTVFWSGTYIAAMPAILSYFHLKKGVKLYNKHILEQ